MRSPGRAGTLEVWPVAHDAFAARAGPLLEQPPAAVAYLGIDEHRRGRPRWKLDEDTRGVHLARGPVAHHDLWSLPMPG